MGRTFSVKQLMERYQVDRRVIAAWGKSGELVGVNVSTSIAAKKPRLRFTEEAIASFEKRRAMTPPAAVQRRRRQSKKSASPWADYG